MADSGVPERTPLVSLTPAADDLAISSESPATGEFRIEITVSGSDKDQVFMLEGKWQEKDKGRLESELHGLVSSAPDRSDELPVTGSAAVHVERLLGWAPLQVRLVELNLEFGDSRLRVRHNVRRGMQLFGLKVPGLLIVRSEDDAHGEAVDVRINWDQMISLAMNLVFTPPTRQDHP